mgnify:FL=1
MVNNDKEIGVYVHIPFCKRKCYYCDFISFCEKDELQEKYINTVIQEIEDFFNLNKNVKIKTIYIGGGTPSFIDGKYIEKIMNTFNKEGVVEATIEVNPGSASLEKLKKYKECGINRLSIGLQSTEDRLLKKIGRIHNYNDFLATYNLAREVGFDNINVDLMIGLPGQTIEDVKSSLNKVINLNPSHISVYSLIVEENTIIYNLIEQNKIVLPDEELERNMYWYVKNYLELGGYEHYEISNFAKNGKMSLHNLDCWNQKEYVGFGVSAHSYLNRKRFCNIGVLEEYIKDFKNTKEVQEVQSFYETKQEYMLLGLRKIKGVCISDFKNKFGENPIFLFKNELNKLIEEGLLEITTNNIKLTNKGLNFANLVWEEFV